MNKRCSCGVIHTQFPEETKIHAKGSPFDGAYFNCAECGSTLYIPKIILDAYVDALKELNKNIDGLEKEIQKELRKKLA